MRLEMNNNEDFRKTLYEAIRFAKVGLVTLEKTLFSAVKKINVITTSIGEYINSDEFKESIRNILREGEEAGEDVKRFKEVIIAMGYPPSDNMDMRLIRKIGKVILEHDADYLKKIIDDIMLEFHTPDRITEIKLEWEHYIFLKDRLPLLRQALNAHNLGMYAITIPSLLSQMEGIIIDGFELKKKVKGYEFECLVKVLFNHDDVNPKKEIQNDQEEIFDFDRLICEFYLKFLLAPFEHGQQEVSRESRHAILHGGARPITYDHEHISLKMIIMMDNIIYKVSLLTADKKEKAKLKLIELQQNKKKKNKEKRRKAHKALS